MKGRRRIGLRLEKKTGDMKGKRKAEYEMALCRRKRVD